MESAAKRVSEFDRVRRLSRPQKLLLAQRGERVERLILSTEPDADILFYLCKNPRITLDEIMRISKLLTLTQPVIDQIMRNSAWMQSEEIRLNLILNPKTSVSTALRLLPSLALKNLRSLAKNFDLRPSVKQAALRLLIQRGQSNAAGGRP